MLFIRNVVVTVLLIAGCLVLPSLSTADEALVGTVFPAQHPVEPAMQMPLVNPAPQLASLSDAILFYERIQQSDRWRPIADGPLLKAGDRHIQVAELRGLLSLLGDLPPQNVYQLASTYFDDALAAALMRFQVRHSAKVDGVLGPDTRRRLNIPPWQRIDQLVLNLYRQRLLPAGMERYIHVNLPEYRLRYYQQGALLLEMRTVVGKPDRQTPVFAATVNRLVVNPDWNVPKSIALKDILPRLKEDPDFLEKHNLRILSGWNQPNIEVAKNEVDLNRMYQGADYFRFWEPPGENNTLGRLKFQLSTDNSIYLHDTRQKYLFDVDRRAFSSGCIRLENPRRLADVLVEDANQWSADTLTPLFEQQGMIKIRLYNPIPIYVTYWTAWLDEAGTLHFADDVYQRDHVDFAELQPRYQQLGMRTN